MLFLLPSVLVAKELTPFPHKIVQRICIHDPIPVGWRLATVQDASSNIASFSQLLCKSKNSARLVDGRISGRNSLAKIESDGSIDGIGSKIIVNFEPGSILHFEKELRGAFATCEFLGPLIILSMISLVTFIIRQEGYPSESLRVIGFIWTFICGLFSAPATFLRIFIALLQLVALIAAARPSLFTQTTVILTFAWGLLLGYFLDLHYSPSRTGFINDYVDLSETTHMALTKPSSKPQSATWRLL